MLSSLRDPALVVPLLMLIPSIPMEGLIALAVGIPREVRVKTSNPAYHPPA